MTEQESSTRARRPWPSWIALLLLMGVALALRWRYIEEISLFVDEFVTAWAARNIPVRGFPSFPSGNIYPHGFVFTYLVAPFVLGEFNETLLRLPALLVGLAGITVGYWVGRRLFSEQVGLITAAVMAVEPAFIVWGSRARMYGLLQLLAVLVVFFLYRGLTDDRARDRYLAMALLVLAIFTHAEAALLIPVLLVAALVICGWRALLRWSVILPFGIAGVGALAFLALSKFGQPGHLETLQESRPYLAVSMNALRTSGVQAFSPVFLAPYRIPLTVLLVSGLYFLVRPRFDRSSALTYLYVVGSSYFFLLSFLAGAGWQRERYLFLILPFLFLAAADVLTRILALLPIPKSAQPWLGPVLALLVALYIGLTGTRTAFTQEWGYDQAFRYLRDQWQPEAGDRVATSMSTAAMLYLGRNDAFAIQQGYEEYIVPRATDGRPVDLWTATPVLTSTADFAELLASAPRLWFVTDGWRFQTRYDPDFVMTVLDQMHLDYNERGVMIFRGEGYRPAAPPAMQRERRGDFGQELALDGFALSPLHPTAGDDLEVTLYWRALAEAGPAYVALLHLVGPDGGGQAGVDELVLQGLYQPDLWPEGIVMPDAHRLTLPEDLPAGRYRLDLGLYHPQQVDQPLQVGGEDRLPLAALTLGNYETLPQPPNLADAQFGNEIRLLGYDLDSLRSPGESGDAVDVTLYWQATAPMVQDYTVFVHLVGPDGEIISQDDAVPGDPFFPTSTWLPGDVVNDFHVLQLPPGVAEDEYTLLVGLYHQPTAARLQVTDTAGKDLGDSLPITIIPHGTDAP